MSILNGLFGAPQPSDPLERALLAYAQGRASAEWLAGELRDAQLVVLLEGDGSAVAEGASIRPLAVSTPIGYSVLCAFTASERAQEMRAAYQAWGTELVVDFPWLLAMLPVGHGIVINPGHDACAFLCPEDVDRFRGEQRLAA